MELLREFLKKEFNVELSAAAEEKFVIFRQTLKEWNKKMNLTSIAADEDIEKKHFIDSLAALKTGIKENEIVLDVGTGAGFPGVPLKIFYPSLKLTLAESVRKKTEFLRALLKKLEISDVEVINSRSEELPADWRERFDYVLSRALAPFAVSAELVLPWVKLGGHGLFYLKDLPETKKISEISKILGGDFSKVVEYVLPGDEETRRILMIKKIEPTSLKYPRRAGMAKKRPLIKL